MKKFYISKKGMISQHKMRTDIAGMGLLHEDQYIKIYTNKDQEMKVKYDKLVLGGHIPKQLIYLKQNEVITKIDIVSKVNPLYATAKEYLATEYDKNKSMEMNNEK